MGQELARDELNQLVERAKNYDREAFGKIYDVFFDKVYNYIYGRVGNHASTEDLTQTVFVKVLEAIDRYECKGLPFSAWIFRIASNQVIDFYRSNKNVASLDKMEPLPGDRAETDPEKMAVFAGEKDELYRAMRTLTDEQRQVISLRFMADLSNEEVAEVMGKRIGAVKALQHRALASLRRTLKGSMQNAEERIAQGSGRISRATVE